MVNCSICGNAEFKPAPFNRLSQNGLPPVCTKCGSLERHRIFRELFNAIRTPDYKGKRCLQFSLDPSTAGGWFAEREISVYGGQNSIDLQNIDRESGSYDVVVCNHVLEHVPNYRTAVNELARVTSDEGYVFLSFPNPYIRAETEDWGYPREDQHLHYRLFGRDVEDVFKKVLPYHHILAIEAEDPVTGQRDIAYILTKSDDLLSHIFQCGVKTRIAAVRREPPELAHQVL